MGGKSGSQPAGQTTQTSTTAPWSAQQPYLTQGFSDAANLLAANPNGPQYYPGQTYAPATGAQTSGLNSITDVADSLASGANPTIAAGSNYSNAMMNGAGIALNPGTPALTSLAYGGNSSPVAQSVLSQVVPGLESQFIKGGGLSSPGAAYATSQGATTALAPIEYNAALQAGSNLSSGFNTGVSNTNNVLANLGNTVATMFAPGQNLYSAGSTEQQLNQNTINDAIQRFNYNGTATNPGLGAYQALNEFLSQINGSFGGTTTTSTPYFQNQLANGLGAVGGGLSLFNGVKGLFGNSTPTSGNYGGGSA